MRNKTCRGEILDAYVVVMVYIDERSNDIRYFTPSGFNNHNHIIIIISSLRDLVRKSLKGRHYYSKIDLQKTKPRRGEIFRPTCCCGRYTWWRRFFRVTGLVSIALIPTPCPEVLDRCRQSWHQPHRESHAINDLPCLHFNRQLNSSTSNSNTPHFYSKSGRSLKKTGSLNILSGVNL